MTLILVIVLIIVLFGSGPWFPYSRGWGYRPFGGLTFILILLIVLMLVGVV